MDHQNRVLKSEGSDPKLSMMAMQYSSGEDYYFICMEIFCKGEKRTKQVSISGNL